MGSTSGLEMTVQSKYKRRCTRRNEESDLDRISKLPDHIISHILSCLDLKCAIRTSVLSSRWRFLWVSVGVLNFIDFYFRDDDSFSEFVEHVLLHSTSKDIRIFSLNCFYFIDLARFNAWINHVFSTKNFYACILRASNPGRNYFPVPPSPKCILSCNTLISLTFYSRFEIEIPTSTVSFPFLQDLCLTGVYPEDGELLHKLLGICPVLEEFHLKAYLRANELVVLSICKPSLKRLHLELMIDKFGFHDHSVIIHTPKLEDLSIVDNTFAIYEIKPLDSINKVWLEVGGSYIMSIEPDHVGRLVQLIGSVAKTEHLLLTSCTTAVLSCSNSLNWPWRDDWPMFQNLTELTLCTYEISGWVLLPGILDSSTYLKSLKLVEDHKEKYKIKEKYAWDVPEEVPDCVLFYLTTVSFENFEGREDELDIVEYLLYYSESITLMEIHTLPCCLNNALVETLVTFPRASEHCRVEVYEAK